MQPRLSLKTWPRQIRPKTLRALGLPLALALSAALHCGENLRVGLDASLGVALAGPFRPGLAPGFGVSVYHALNADWDAGLAYSQHTFFEADYYVSARSLDLRLRRGWRLNPGLQFWSEAGAGINPMAWHFSNWPGWGRISAETGMTWASEKGPDWELGLGLAAYGPPERGLVHGLLRVGPRW